MNENFPPETKDISLRQAAIISGVGLLLMTIVAPIANLHITKGDISPVDIRLALVGFLIVTLLDVIVAWGLYVFLKPVNESLSLFTAWLRLVYAAILGAALIGLVHALQFSSGADFLTTFDASQLDAQMKLFVRTFIAGWEMGLVVFGFHLLSLGYLAIKSGYVPKIIGGLLVIASLGYLIDGFGRILSPDYGISIALFTFIGEVVLLVWLLVKGFKGIELKRS